SPELIQGREVDHRSDLFSLGATSYELLSGQQVFTGQDANSIYYAILNATVPPLARYRKDLPEGLDRIINKLLERDPGRRYQAAAEVATDIRRLLGPSVSTTRLAVWARSAKRTIKRVPAGVWICGGLLLGLLAGVLIIKPEASLIDLSAYEFTPMAVEAVPETGGVWSPDGRKFIYQRRFEDRDWRIMFRDTSATEASPIVRFSYGAQARSLFWASSSDSFYYVNNGWLFVSGIQEGMIPTRTPLGDISVADIHPHDPIIASWRKNRLTVRDLNGNVLEEYQPIPATIDTLGKTPYHLHFSPDGTRIAFSHYRRPEFNSGSGATSGTRNSGSADETMEEADFGFWIFPWPSSASKEPNEVFNRDGMRLTGVASFDWLDTEHVILAMKGDIWIGNVRNSRLFQIVNFNHVQANNPSVTFTGNRYRLLYEESTADYDVLSIPLDESPPTRIVRTSEYEGSPSYARGSGALAYRHGTDEVRLRYPSTPGEDIIKLSEYLPAEEKPASFWEPFIISPDGEWIAFKIIGRTSGLSVWILSIRNLGEARKTFPDTLGEHGGYGFAWSPGSDSLVTTCKTPTGPGLAVVDRRDPRTCRTIFQYRGEAHPDHLYILLPGWSPDGKWISALTHWTNSFLLISADGRTQKQIRNPTWWELQDLVSTWSQDSRYLYLAATVRGPEPEPMQPQPRGLWQIDTVTGNSEYIRNFDRDLELHSPTTAGVFGSLAPDGNSFVTTARTWKSDLVILEGFPLPRRLRR
ncbi:hypothetical protein ACFL39_02540, partial [Gemmatimonadota bacterium]